MSDKFAEKFKLDKEMLSKYFWGNYFLSDDKKIYYSDDNFENKGNIFIQFGLGSIYKIYESFKKCDMAFIKNICKTTSVKLIKENLNSKEAQHLMTTVLNKWLKIDQAIFKMIV